MENSSCCYIPQIEYIAPVEACKSTDISLALDLTKSSTCVTDNIVPYMKENRLHVLEESIVLQLDVTNSGVILDQHATEISSVNLEHSITENPRFVVEHVENVNDSSAVENPGLVPSDFARKTSYQEKLTNESQGCNKHDENSSKKRKTGNPMELKEKYYCNKKNFENHGIKKKRKNEVKHRSKSNEKKSYSKVSRKLEENLWGISLPDIVLHKIFMMVTHQEGSVPFLFRMGRMCSLWRNVSLSTSLWHTVDLSGSVIKQSYRTEKVLQWLCENRLKTVEDLNLGGWKVVNIQQAIEAIAKNCERLHTLGLSGWYKLTTDHLLYIVRNCPNLKNVDLSNCSPEDPAVYLPGNSAVGLASIKTLMETMGERLTHFNMSKNILRQQTARIFSCIIANCPNLQVLDLSNVVNQTSIGKISVISFQENCKKLRVLRLANCSVDTSVTSAEYMNASGFPLLEELSVATDESFPYINDLTLTAILKESYNLKLLDVRGCPNLTDSSILGIPASNLEFLFLSGSAIVKPQNARLQPIIHKWSHSLIEIDLSWAASKVELNTAVEKFAILGSDCPLKVLTLCGTGIELSTIKEVITKCPNLTSLNLSSCRELPRGMKHPYEGKKEISLLQKRLNN